MREEYYEGICPVGNEVVAPKDKIGFIDTPEGRELAKAPWMSCPIHKVKVQMFVVDEARHNQVWAAIERR